MRCHLMHVAKKTLLCLVLAATVLATPARAKAQQLEQPRQRQGYWIQFGLHGLMSETWEKGDHLGPWPGYVLTIRMGQQLTKRFGLGLLFDMGGASGKAWGYNQVEVFYHLAIEAQYNLWRNLGVHYSMGMGIVELMATEGPDQSLRGNLGTSYTVAVTYDFFPLKPKLTGGFSLTPTVMLRYTPGETVDNAMALVGLQIGLWTGMPRNQLELPESEAYKK